MIWVKGSSGDAFKVSVPENADVDDLKDAIKKKMEFTFGAPELLIAGTESGVPLKPSLLISTLTKGNSEECPIYFRKPDKDVIGQCIL
jgi:small-conductance mechanosensitive channel